MADNINQYIQGLLGQNYQTPMQGGLLGAAQAVAPLAGYTSRPVSMGQVIGAAGGGAMRGQQQAQMQNMMMGSNVQQMQQGKAQMEAAKVAAGLAAKDRAYYKGVPKEVFLENMKAGKNPFGGGTTGKMWEYYSAGASNPYYDKAVAYLSKPHYIQTPMGTIQQPAAINADGSLISGLQQGGSTGTTATPNTPSTTGGSPIVPGSSPTALATAKEKFASKQEMKKNQRSYDTFSIGVKQLTDALAGTDTGPVVGRFPALTTAQQSADGAIAAMAPVLKTLFREAGEGTFTEADQKILMDMLPNRSDYPETITNKVAMVNALVMSKLGITGGGGGSRL